MLRGESRAVPARSDRHGPARYAEAIVTVFAGVPL